MRPICSIIFFLLFQLSVKNAYCQCTVIYDFSGTANGNGPAGALVSDGTYLYGTTAFGGANGWGAVFKIKTDGTGYTNLYDFPGAPGGYQPAGGLFFDGSYLYGMTTLGGTNGLGTIFKIMPDGSNFSTTLDLSGSATGSFPYGALISDGTYLYGMTHDGGTNDSGVVFRILPNGASFSKLIDFGSNNGRLPYRDLLYDGTYLYGMTSQGGANNMGTLFKVLPDGTNYSKLMDLAGAANGSYPYGSLITDGVYLYGMTSFGGVNGMGTIFKLLTNGSGYTKLADLDGTTTGSYPFYDLLLDGSLLYGTTSSGGLNGNGTVFSISTAGGSLTTLVDFSSSTTGNNSRSTLISDGSFLYGTTQMGGANNMGVLFKVNISATGISFSEKKFRFSLSPNPAG